MDSWTSLALLVVLKSQGMADSNSYQFWMSPGLLFSYWILSSSLAWSQLLSIPNVTSMSWGKGVYGFNCNFWSFHLISGSQWLIKYCPGRDWSSQVKGSMLVYFVKASTTLLLKRVGFSFSSWVTHLILSKLLFFWYTFSPLLMHIVSRSLLAIIQLILHSKYFLVSDSRKVASNL